MSELRTDEEQSEIVKKWWSENALGLIATVVIASGSVFGWNYWQDQKRANAEAASATYSKLIELVAQEGTDKKSQLITLAERLKNDYADTTYADFASLFIARTAVDHGDFIAAESELKELIDSADSEPVKELAKARLARVLIQMDRADDALAVLPAEATPAFVLQIEEARGDALYRKGEFAEARLAYQRAVESARGLGQSVATLERKIDSLVVAASESEDA
ncbi:MAG: tetratricopeptide repeat protein [Oleibacter sp.]|nr:tetratricopeptide repeat protein [Thalassolituus sp.]